MNTAVCVQSCHSRLCVSIFHELNNIDNQLDATITVY